MNRGFFLPFGAIIGAILSIIGVRVSSAKHIESAPVAQVPITATTTISATTSAQATATIPAGSAAHATSTKPMRAAALPAKTTAHASAPDLAATNQTASSSGKTILSSSDAMQFILSSDDGTIDAYDYKGNHTGLVSLPGSDISLIARGVPGSSLWTLGSDIDILLDVNTNGYIVIHGLRNAVSELDILTADAKLVSSYIMPMQKGSIGKLPVVSSPGRVDIGPMEFDQDGNGQVDQIIHASN